MEERCSSAGIGCKRTGLGPAAYFIEFLKTNGLWERWVEDCPLYYTSPNAPAKQDILGVHARLCRIWRSGADVDVPAMRCAQG